VHDQDANRSPKEFAMNKRLVLIAAVACVAAGIAYAQYPILDAVAGKVVQKYQSASCEQLWEKKGEPKPPEEQRVIGLLKSDPQMRTEFINRVAAPIANKMFECGMIP
jgi:hypothetical protein